MKPRFLVLGAGPAGLYLSKALLKHFGRDANIDMLSKDFLPGGLLRWGVAPDHFELKSSISQFDHLFEAENFNFCGNEVQ